MPRSALATVRRWLCALLLGSSACLVTDDVVSTLPTVSTPRIVSVTPEYAAAQAITPVLIDSESCRPITLTIQVEDEDLERRLFTRWFVTRIGEVPLRMEFVHTPIIYTTGTALRQAVSWTFPFTNPGYPPAVYSIAVYVSEAFTDDQNDLTRTLDESKKLLYTWLVDTSAGYCKKVVRE